MSNSVNSKITLRLLIDVDNHKVLFGEAYKDFVDFLFSLLTLPLGSAIKLISPCVFTGSIARLYQSVEKLEDTYLIANNAKSSLLQPKVFTFDVTNPLLICSKASTVEHIYYLCNYCNKTVTTTYNIICPNCKHAMVAKVDFVAASASSTCSALRAGDGREDVGGFVKGAVTYMITDDLKVTPMSFVSCFALSLKKDMKLVDKVVNVGMKEGLALLKASLDSATALTDVFLSS